MGDSSCTCPVCSNDQKKYGMACYVDQHVQLLAEDGWRSYPIDARMRFYDKLRMLRNGTSPVMDDLRTAFAAYN